MADLKKTTDDLEDEPIDPSIQANATAGSIQRSMKFLIIATLVLYIGGCLVVAWVYSSVKANTDALCALRKDIQLRIVTNQQFLIEHPNGTAAIPKAALLTTIQNSQRTIEALSGVNCQTEVVAPQPTSTADSK